MNTIERSMVTENNNAAPGAEPGQGERGIGIQNSKSEIQNGTPRLPDESTLAYEAFLIFRDLGPSRSLSTVVQRTGRAYSTVRRWSASFDWCTRARAYSAQLAVIRESGVRAQAAEWNKRQHTVRADEWELREECLRTARAAFEQFVAQKRPATLAEIARIVELTSKLGRLATGLTTEHVAQSTQVDVNLQLEIESAIKKVYGPIVDVESKPAEGGASVPARRT